MLFAKLVANLSLCFLMIMSPFLRPSQRSMGKITIRSFLHRVTFEAFQDKLQEGRLKPEALVQVVSLSEEETFEATRPESKSFAIHLDSVMTVQSKKGWSLFSEILKQICTDFESELFDTLMVALMNTLLIQKRGKHVTVSRILSKNGAKKQL